MIMCERSELGDRLSVPTGSTGTFNIGDVIDTQGVAIGHGANANINRGFDPNLWLVVRVMEAFTSAGAAAVAFRLVSDDSATLSTTTATHHAQGGALPVASLIAGTDVLTLSARDVVNCERYLGAQIVVAGAALTGGLVSMFFTQSPSLLRSYADNVR